MGHRGRCRNCKDDAPRGYHEFDEGAARKYVLDPHGMLASR